MQISYNEVENYLEAIQPELSQAHQKLEDFALKTDFPIVGKIVGNFLSQLVLLTGSKLIFEVGSGFGYSAFWFAKTLPKNGKIICTDLNPKYKEMAEKSFFEEGISKKIEFYVGNGLTILEERVEKFDLILLDCDKYLYPKALPIAMEKLNLGGLLVTDNILRVKKKKVPQKINPYLETYRKMLLESEELHTTILPLKDGIGLSYKIK